MALCVWLLFPGGPRGQGGHKRIQWPQIKGAKLGWPTSTHSHPWQITTLDWGCCCIDLDQRSSTSSTTSLGSLVTELIGSAASTLGATRVRHGDGVQKCLCSDWTQVEPKGGGEWRRRVGGEDGDDIRRWLKGERQWQRWQWWTERLWWLGFSFYSSCSILESWQFRRWEGALWGEERANL